MNKIIHQIWVGPEVMQVRERRCSRLIKSKNPSWEYMFWNDENVPKLPEKMQEVYDFFGQTKQYTFQADVLRLFLVREYGGLYLDVDFEPHNSFDDFETMDNLFLTWGVNQERMMNGAFGANIGDKAIISLCDKVDMNTRFYGPDWFANSLKDQDVNKMTFDDFLKKYAYHHHLASWIK